MPGEHKFEQQGQNITDPQTNIAGDVQGPVLSGRFEVIQSIITTGNNSPVFVGYEKLRDAVIQPDQVFKRVQTESFVGRRWLIDQVDRILNNGNNSCGYLILEGHAGLGKTAFLAWLVKERNYIHHFVELAPGQEGIERGLKNLAAQIILAYKLSADEAIPDAAGRPDYLYHLLSQAAEKRAPGERIVVVVDALDEAGTPSWQNVLGLPKVLPEGVFFIVSMRPVQVILQSDESRTPRQRLEILAESNENLEDIKIFLKASAGRPNVKRALEASRYTTDGFVDALVKKSQGLWIYLHFVIPEIESGKRSPLDLEKLPEGLQEYYANYWARWRNDEKWYDICLPILTTLAAAQEPCTLDRILDWARIEANEGERRRLRNLLNEEWRPFLAISSNGMEEKYHFYHATVREFFEGKAEQNRALAVESYRLNELSQATKERHMIIAERYLAIWGGLENGLPNFMDKKDDDGYGLHHLASHLEASGQDNELHHLFKLETSQGRNLWFEAKEAGGDTAGYINDVMRAWRLARLGYDRKDIKRTGKLIALQNRYALIFTSLNSLSGNIPSELLLALVENGVWSEEEGLAHARCIPDQSKRSLVLAELSSLLEEPKYMDEALLQAQAIQNMSRGIQDIEEYHRTLAKIVPRIQDIHYALAMSREIEDDYCRAIALAEIAPRLPDAQKIEILNEALLVARESKDSFGRAENYYWRTIALAEIAPRLPDAQKLEVLNEALSAAQEIMDDEPRANALFTIAPKLQDIDEALAISRRIQNDYWRAIDLAEIVPRLPDAQKLEVLNEALSAAREIKDDRSRAIVLAKIVPKLQDIDEALEISRRIQDNYGRAKVLAKITPRLPDAQKIEILNEALSAIQEIKDDQSRYIAQVRIASKLQDAHEALEIARKMPDDYRRSIVLAEIAPRLQDADEALAIAQKIKDDYRRAIALAEIAPRLPEAEKINILDEALLAAQKIKDDHWRAEALSNIAPKFPDAKKIEILDEALSATNKIRKQPWSDIVIKLPTEEEAEEESIYLSPWDLTIYDLSNKGRNNLLSDLSFSAPLIARLGGDDALRETIEAIKDVGRWWP